jgi:hypothetical protein
MRPRLLLTLAALTVVALGVGGPANAGHECDGLDVCVSVTGPWVVVPTGAKTPTYYQLRCPRRGMIVGGLDANVSDRAIAIQFLGNLGSPVNPGITTSNAVVFVATYAGRGRGPVSFQPLIGCMPTAGGGRGTTSLGATPTLRPGTPTTRRVRTIKLRAGTKRLAAQSCRRDEHLVSSSVALAFRRKAAPSSELVDAVRLTPRKRADTALAAVAVSKSLPFGAHAEVQIDAVCARG